MRSSLVGLQLLLACVLVWGTSVVEEKKECCGPGVPPEKSCCPKDNATSQEPEKQKKLLGVPADPEEEELEKRAEEYRESRQNNVGLYGIRFMKQEALDHFNKRSSAAFYRPIEDTNIQVKDAIGTILVFTQFLVNTNCTKEEGRRHEPRSPWHELRSTETVPCVAVPKEDQKRLKCRVHMFMDARSGRSSVLWQECEAVLFSESIHDSLDPDHWLDSPPLQFGSFF